MLAVGVVTATHGVTGELKIKSLSGQVDHLLAIREALFRKSGMEKRLRIESSRPQVAGIIAKVEGLETPETARRLVGCELWVPRPLAAPLDFGEYYASDLCRCRLWFKEREIGVVKSVWDGGSAQLLEIRGNDGRTFLVPFTDHFIGEVDLAAGRMVLKVDEIVR
jgi:16S rRNA processing protein RimM